MFGFGGCGKHGGGPFGFGQPPWAHRMHRMRGGFGAILADLDLTDEQLEKVAELKMEGLSKFAQFKSTVVGLVQQIGKELTKDQVDKAKVKEIAQQIKAHKSELGDTILDRVLTFTEVLTVEQRRKLRLKLIKRFLGVDTRAPEAE
jgi:Spy/CpxP family protein refolding chaperone